MAVVSQVYYIPRESSHVLITTIYVPPSVSAKDAANVTSSHVITLKLLHIIIILIIIICRLIIMLIVISAHQLYIYIYISYHNMRRVWSGMK